MTSSCLAHDVLRRARRSSLLLPLCSLLALASPAAQGATPPACPAVLNHALKPLIGDQPESLCQHAGKVVLVVNTASACGFTPQYEGLEKLWKTYAARGLVVVGVPANDFGQQEKGSNQEIAAFCKANYGVSFPMTSKLETPLRQSPLFAGLIKATGQAPQWNFHKYLIDRNGKVISFATSVEPGAQPLVSAIEQALKARP